MVGASGTVVRRLQPDEWQVLRDLRLRALADAPDAFASTLERERAFTEDDWEWRVVDGCAVVALAGDDPVGLAGGYLNDGVPELISMWVDPEARGTGAADALVDGVVAWAREQGADRLILWVVEGNERAERAYLRLGFTRTGLTQPVPGRPDRTEAEMARSFR